MESQLTQTLESQKNRSFPQPRGTTSEVPYAGRTESRLRSVEGERERETFFSNVIESRNSKFSDAAKSISLKQQTAIENHNKKQEDIQTLRSSHVERAEKVSQSVPGKKELKKLQYQQRGQERFEKTHQYQMKKENLMDERLKSLQEDTINRQIRQENAYKNAKEQERESVHNRIEDIHKKNENALSILDKNRAEREARYIQLNEHEDKLAKQHTEKLRNIQKSLFSQSAQRQIQSSEAKRRQRATEEERRLNILNQVKRENSGIESLDSSIYEIDDKSRLNRQKFRNQKAKLLHSFDEIKGMKPNERIAFIADLLEVDLNDAKRIYEESFREAADHCTILEVKL